MSKKNKNITSILLLLVFLLPSIIKLSHHHEHFVSHPQNEKHYHTQHEKCAVCNFEFSMFLSEKSKVAFAKIEFPDTDTKSVINCHHTDLSKYSFLLRAPPVFINQI